MSAANDVDEERVKRLAEASEWLLSMQGPELTDEQITGWLRWIDSAPDNAAEFDRVQRDWIDLDALKRHDSQRSNLRWRAWALAAGLAAAAVALGSFYYFHLAASGPRQEVAATVINRAATLPDGSKMILGVESRVNMDFNGPMRELDLSDGEAYFEVKHDKSRPFVVQAGEVSVTAIGTAFDVRRDPDRITVTVEEGVVEIASAAPRGARAGSLGASRNTWRAEAGYQLTYSISNRTASLASVSPSAVLAWRKGELAYVREPLGSVVENLNHYFAHKVVIEDSRIASLPFTGTAFASSLDDWLSGIEQAYSIKATPRDNGDIVLTLEK